MALLRWPGATSKPASSTHIWIRAKALLSLGFASKDGNLPIGNVYLESGVGPSSGVNPGILAALIMFIQELRMPWITG